MEQEQEQEQEQGAGAEPGESCLASCRQGQSKCMQMYVRGETCVCTC
jgi:hypothetical protein